MTRGVLSALPQALVLEVENASERAGVHRIVVAEAGKPLGVVCRCDLAAARASLPVWRAMRTPALTISARDPLAVAVLQMQEYRVGCLPVVDERGVLTGIVTRRDLRRMGFTDEQAGMRLCVSCGTSHSVVPTKSTELAFCFECLERARGDTEFELYGTLGGSG
jgi:CBS-domain-containing membrane protein